MPEHSTDFWERVLSEIVDDGFFGVPAGRKPVAMTPHAASPVLRCRQGARRRWARSPARVATHPAGRCVTSTDACAAKAQGWREVLGPDVTRVLVPALAPVLIALLAPIVVLAVLVLI